MSAGVWGIYRQNETPGTVIRGGFQTTAVFEPVIEFDALLSIDVKEETRITSYPVEEGGFTAAAKVISPAQITVTGAVSELGELQEARSLDEFEGLKGRAYAGADLTRITKAIEALEKYKNSTELVDIITPHKTYLDVNLTAFSYKHSAQGGLNMLEATLTLQEVRKVQPQYTTIEVRNPKYKTAPDEGKTPTENPASVALKIDGWTGGWLSDFINRIKSHPLL
jgi:hypothetical protein